MCVSFLTSETFLDIKQLWTLKIGFIKYYRYNILWFGWNGNEIVYVSWSYWKYSKHIKVPQILFVWYQYILVSYLIYTFFFFFINLLQSCYGLE